MNAKPMQLVAPRSAAQREFDERALVAATHRLAILKRERADLDDRIEAEFRKTVLLSAVLKQDERRA